MLKSNQFRPPAMILRRMRPAILTHRLETHVYLQVAPHLHLAAAAAPQAGALRIETIVRGNAGERILRREEYVRHIAERGARREQGAQAGPKLETTVPIMATPSSRPVPAVLLRSHPAATAAPEPQSTTPAFAPKSWPPPPAPQAAHVDVNRLTEQVIQQIDRRLQSYRERTGRR
jgi:hypothetical protein